MTETDINWESDVWTVIDNYFKTENNYMSSTQLDSYNTFLRQQIPKTIRQFNPITALYNPIDNDEGDFTGTHQFKIEFYIGGSCEDEVLTPESEIVNDAKGVYIKKPIIQQKKYNEDGSSSFVIKQLFPNEARLKNLTYKADITCDIYVILTSFEVIGGEERIEGRVVKKFNDIPIGGVPIMLHSNICTLNNMVPDTLYSMGECPYDQGGYFIIDGKEKVIVAQERQVENKLYIKEFTGKEEKYNLELEIRSVPEVIFQPARIIKVFFLNKRVNSNEHIDQDTIRVVIPNINIDLPIFAVFRALGVVSDKDILHLVVDDLQSDIGKEMLYILRPSIVEASLINTQSIALDLLKSNISAYGKSLPKNKQTVDAFLIDILRNYFLPHVGKDFIQKAHFFGYMIKEMLLTKLKYKPPTDRDSFINKRVDISGFLIGNIFRDLYFRVKNEFEQNLNTFYYDSKNERSLEPDTFWSQEIQNTGDKKSYMFYNIIDTDSTKTSIHLNKLLNRKLVDEGFMYAFKNAWGLKNSTSRAKEGVVQDLNRLNYLGYISHIRRVNITLSKSTKIRAPHQLHASSYGIMCPDETPDGANIGIRKNIALFAKVTFGVNSEPLYKALLVNNTIPIYNIELKKVCNLSSVFLNERLVGYHLSPETLVERLKLFRRNALINIYTSIAWYPVDNIIKISTDSGRCCRPLFIVKNNEIMFTKNMLDGINNNRLSWRNLIGGVREGATDFTDDNDKFICPEDNSNEFLESYSGVIEYIDTEEANTCLIAMNPTDLDNQIDKDICKFTHCEIHPSLMFGVLGNNLPLIERNQHPRNQFSTAHGKQAIGIYATNFRNRMDTKGQVLYYPEKPLLRSMMSKYLNTNELPQGINAIVAIGCYTGYNQEDSILFNKDAVQRGLFTTIKYKTYSNREEIIEGTNEREIFMKPDITVTRNMKSGNYSKLDPSTGLIREGEKVNDNDILVGKVVTTKETDNNGNKIYIDNSDYVKRNESGFIDKVYFNFGNDNQKYTKIRIRKEKSPEVGDKFCSRFGQKGTIGTLVNACDMPVTRDGIVPDLVVNPHAIPSRMTIGQLLEVILGKASSISDTLTELAAFTELNINKIGDILEDTCDYEKHGNEILYNGRTGQQMKVSLFIGPTYYQRLTHQVGDKFYSRNEGSTAALSHQPVGGRAAGGGLRIGEMERDAVLAHGTSQFLKETMMERSDKYKFYISDKSGLISIVNEDKNIFEDFSNDATEIKISNDGTIIKKSSGISDAKFYCIEAPYAFKLFLQEIESMGIAPRLIVKETVTNWQDPANISIQEIEAMKQDSTVTSCNYDKESYRLTYPLNTFKNEIRSMLLDGSGHRSNTSSLLDFSVGDASDIYNWYKSNYTFILGFDTNADKIGEKAPNNLKKLQESKDPDVKVWAKSADINFIVGNPGENIRTLAGISPLYTRNLDSILELKDTNSFNTAVSFFSIQEQFKSLANIENLLQNVKENIKPGGYFIVTCLDGDVVYSKLKSASQNREYLNGIIIDESTGDPVNIWGIKPNTYTKMTSETLPHMIEDPDAFNNSISISFGNMNETSDECLVHPTLLINIAAKFGLHIISNTEASSNFKNIESGTGMFSELYQLYTIQNSDTTNIKYINDLGKEENKGLKEFSDMFRYYIFKYEDTSLIDNQFTTKKECTAFMENRMKLRQNVRYIPYNQYLLAAGDVSQLHEYLVIQRALHGPGVYVNNNVKANNISNIYTSLDIKSNIINKRLSKILNLSIYTTLNQTSFENTLKYMFENMKYGIFIKIKNGILTMFSPFFNNGYKNIDNELSFINMSVDSEKYPGGLSEYYEKKNLYFKDQATLSNLLPQDQWWADNCIIHNSNNLDLELSTNFGELKSMLENLCQERGASISDSEFFINNQLFPNLQIPDEDGNIKHPYFHSRREAGENISKNLYKNYMPILSSCVTDNYADIAIPSSNDWRIATNKIYPPDCYNTSKNVDILWEDKLTLVFFRGTSAGCGTTPETNQRLNILRLVESWSKMQDRHNLMDISITAWDNEDVIYMREYMNFTEGLASTTDKNRKISNIRDLNINNVSKSDIHRGKYLLYIDSYCASSIFTEYLKAGGVIFKTSSIYDYKLWYFDILEELSETKDNWQTATHISITSDFSNLYDVVRWCIENDSKCKQIASNSRDFYNKYLDRTGLLDYLENTINQISKNITNDSVVTDLQHKVIDENIISIDIQFPKSKLNHLFGQKGKNINRIRRLGKSEITVYTGKDILGEGEWKGVITNNVLIYGPESGAEKAKQEILKIAHEIEKKIECSLKDIGKLIGKRYRHIDAIKKHFMVNVTITTVPQLDIKEIKIRGIESNVDCAIKAFESLQNMGSLERALHICVENSNIYDPNTIYKDTYFDTEQYIDFEFDVEKHTLGILIPCISDLSSHTPLNGEESGEDKLDQIIVAGLNCSIEIKKILHEKEKLINSGLYEKNKIFNYKVFVLHQSTSEIEYTDKDGKIIRENIAQEILQKVPILPNTTATLKCNRGALINSGAIIALENGCDYIVINNPDLIPNEELLNEYCVFPKNPVNLSSIIPKYNNSLNTFSKPSDILLGAVKINLKQFINIGGYPNDMWGLGYEDYIFMRRLDKKDIELTNLINSDDMYNYIDNNLIYNDSKANNNIIGDNQLRYIDEVYLSNNSLSNIKQSLWFNLEESLHITGDNDIHYISFVYDSILPVYNKQTDDWFEQFIKSQEQSIINDSFTKHDALPFIYTFLETSFRFYFNIDITIENTDITVPYSDIIPIKYIGNDQVKQLYLENFYKRMGHILYVLKNSIQLLINKDLINMSLYSSDIELSVDTLTLSIKETINKDAYDVMIKYTDKHTISDEISGFQYAYPIDSSFITYKNVPILDLHMTEIEEERNRVSVLKTQLDTKYNEYMENVMREVEIVIKSELVVDILGKYVCYYDDIQDTLIVKDILQNKVINMTLTNPRTQRADINYNNYKVFINTLYYKLQIKKKTTPVFYKQAFGNITTTLKHQAIIEDVDSEIGNKQQDLDSNKHIPVLSELVEDDSPRYEPLSPAYGDSNLDYYLFSKNLDEEWDDELEGGNSTNQTDKIKRLNISTKTIRNEMDKHELISINEDLSNLIESDILYVFGVKGSGSLTKNKNINDKGVIGKIENNIIYLSLELNKYENLVPFYSNELRIKGIKKQRKNISELIDIGDSVYWRDDIENGTVWEISKLVTHEDVEIHNLDQTNLVKRDTIARIRSEGELEVGDLVILENDINNKHEVKSIVDDIYIIELLSNDQVIKELYDKTQVYQIIKPLWKKKTQIYNKQDVQIDSSDNIKVGTIENTDLSDVNNAESSLYSNQIEEKDDLKKMVIVNNHEIEDVKSHQSDNTLKSKESSIIFVSKE